MKNDPDCVSDLTLDRLLQGELSPDRVAAVEAHLRTCERCRMTLADMKQRSVAFAESGEIPMLAARARRTARNRQVVRWATPLVAVAAAVIAVFFVMRAPKPDERMKGRETLTLLVKHQRDGAVSQVEPGATLSPGDQLRFSVDLHEPAYVTVLSVDSASKVSVYESGPIQYAAGQGIFVDVAVELDDTLGPERFFAILCESAPAEGLLEKATAALSATAGKPEALESIGSPCREASMLIVKAR